MSNIARTFKISVWDNLRHLWHFVDGLFWTVDIHLSGGAVREFVKRAEPKIDLASVTDQELVELCLKIGAKDDRPFKEIFQRHKATVWGVCYRFVRNAEDAEDLTQDVFFRAYRSLGQFEGRSSLKTWLYRIATNVSQNELRRRSRRPQESETSIDILGESLSTHQTPEKQVLAKSRQEQLAQAIETLRPEAAEAIKLKDLEQLPYAEIAERLGVSLSAAKMRVQRARLALMNVYRELEGEVL